MNNTKKRGNLTELQCMTAFMELGYQVSIPFGEDSRYDFVADINDKLYKIQCKSASPVFEDDGQISAIQFSTVRSIGSRATSWTRTKYKSNEIDFFATFFDGMCYLVPVNECSIEKRLRFIPPKNGQKNGINFASNYAIKEVIKQL